MVDVEGGMWEGEMLDVGFGMLDVGFKMLEGGIWNGACGTGMFSHRSQMSTDAMWADISKNTRPGEAYRTIQTLAVILKNTNLSNLSNDD